LSYLTLYYDRDTLRIQTGTIRCPGVHSKTKDGKAVVAINDGDLGRLPIEDLETVEELRNALNEVEEFLEEVERRKEEL